MTAGWPGVPPLPPRLERIRNAEYPRFSAGEMRRRRAAVEAALVEAGCDHLVFHGANRAGSVVQWLTQWPVTVEAVGVPYGADMRLFCARGIPCVMCGTPGLELAHAVDESVAVADLEALARLMVRVAARFYSV